MQALGRDHQWHDWDELSQEEKDEWTEAMNEADRIWENRPMDCETWNLQKSTDEWEQKQRLRQW